MKRLLVVGALVGVAVIPHAGRAQDPFRCQKIAAGLNGGLGHSSEYETVCTAAFDAGLHSITLNWSVGAFGIAQVAVAGPDGGSLYSINCYANGLIDWGCHAESAVPSTYQQAGTPFAGAPIGTGQVYASFLLPSDAALEFRFAPIIRSEVCPSEPDNCIFADNAAGIFTLDGL